MMKRREQGATLMGAMETILQEVGNAFQVQFVKKSPDRAESGQSQGRVRAEWC